MGFKDKFAEFKELSVNKNIILRKANPKKDVDAFYDIYTDTDNFQYYESYNKPKDKNVAKIIVENMIRDFEKCYNYIWVIAQKKDDKAIGRIHLFNFSNNNTCVELGYLLDKKYWNKGIMSSCVKTVTDFAFSHFEIKRLFARAAVDNIGSWKVLEKNKFIREGKMRYSMVCGKNTYDSYMYSKIFSD